ncbi:MAG: hypothetical protein AB7I27_04415 [Bacteriovoracaceae bacterium]
MKKTSAIALSLMTVPLYGASILESLTKYQNDLNGVSNSPISSDKARETIVSSSVNNSKCEEDDQASLPLAYLTSLILKKDPKLDISYDPRNQTLSVSSADMISNCSSMIEWKQRKQVVGGKVVYAIEARFKQGEDCGADGCSYKVAKVKDGSFDKFETMKFPATLKGFESCLEKSGVIDNGKVVAGAIYSSPINEKFQGIEDSGSVQYVSHGPNANIVKAKYKFTNVDKCDFYEDINKDAVSIMNLQDEEAARKSAERSAVIQAVQKDCKDYGKLADFIEKYEDFSEDLLNVRDKSILDAAKKAAAKIKEGKYTDDDLKVIADFQRYIVSPRIALAKAQYDQMLELEGEAKKAKQEELKNTLADLASLNKNYFTNDNIIKLVTDGKFDDAEALKSIQLQIQTHQRIGAKESGVIITPALAQERFVSAKADFAKELADKKERYAISHGEITGVSDDFAAKAKAHRNAVNIRTKNFTAEIQAEYARIQPGGYCTRFYVNQNKCVQDTQERLQALVNLMEHDNRVDSELADEYEAKAADYGKLEAEGRRYVASQTGEEVEEPAKKPEVAAAPQTAPPVRASDDSVYNFNYNPQAFQQQQPTQQYVQPMTYQYNQPNMFPTQQSNPWLGQQQWNNQVSWNPNLNLGFNWNGNLGFQGQQNFGQSQFGYWNQPNAAYSNFSMWRHY